MKVVEHIDKAAEALAEMVADGHLKVDIELSSKITGAQWELKEARQLAIEGGKESVETADET